MQDYDIVNLKNGPKKWKQYPPKVSSLSKCRKRFCKIEACHTISVSTPERHVEREVGAMEGIHITII